ncbi:AAA family ATPase [Actinocrispum sp. NPDC049592]|uniref:LuxR C-terminal-related transcriptional regulator n=1 Tax=Actinocrispum sp. NPDC049592 TaxID=3154835 RepID=UPI0034359985
MRVTALESDSGPEQGPAATEDVNMAVTTAKVTIPPSAPAILVRDRLNTLLDRTAAGGAVTLVRAAAGTGKTTMLAAWARRLAARGDVYVAWACLDSEDNDANLLWQVILQALRTSGAWPALDRLAPPADERYAGFLTAVIAAFESPPKPVVLVLDGIHELHAGEALHTLNVLLRQLPPALRIVLAGRFPPALILPRLKLEGRLREIGPGELTFTAEEARRLYKQEGIQLADSELRLLMRSTEGWAAALRLAAITLPDPARPGEHLACFDAGHRLVADYLRAEILAREPGQVQWFMLATCVSHELPADLAAILSGQENSGQLLDRLEYNGILTRAGDGYRYHPLLRDYLHIELGRSGLAAQQQQHRVAAGWFVTNGDPLAAMEHALAAGDDDLVTRLVARSGLEQVLKGQSDRLRCVIDGLPPHVVNRPSVALVAAVAALDAGDVAAADRRLRGINAHALRTKRLQALHATVQLHRARLHGEVRTALAALRQTSAGETGDLDADLLALLNRGIALAWVGNHANAKADLVQALRLARPERRDAIALECKVHLAAMAVAAGDRSGLTAAALEFAEARDWTYSSRTAYLYTLLGAEAYQRLDDERALRFATLSTNLLPRNVDPTVELSALTLRAVIAFEATETPHRVVGRLREHWRRLSGRMVAPALVAYAAPALQRMALRVGEVGWAMEVLDGVADLDVPCGERVLSQAILYAHKGRLSTTRRLLEPVLSGRTRTLVTTTLVEAWLLEAHLAALSAQDNRAHEALSQALAVAAPYQAVRPFREAGRSVRDLLAHGAGRFGRLEPFATTVRAMLPATLPTTPTDGLTDREQELLLELPSMRTAEEIAQTMFVSVNTVKTHLRGIYRKLGVSQRRDAISVARERGLL